VLSRILSAQLGAFFEHFYLFNRLFFLNLLRGREVRAKITGQRGGGR
jgi:hypothetical protein